MKKIFLLFVLAFSSIIVKAQGDYNFSPLGVGFDVGTIRGYTNVAKQENTLAGDISFTYYDSPYVPLTLELQVGRLEGGSTVTDKDTRQYTNNYKAIYLHGELQLGHVIDYQDIGFLNVIKNIYFGPGVGLVFDNNKVQRTSLDPLYFGYVFPGKDHSVNTAVDACLGYEFKFYNEYDEPYIRLDIAYTHYIVFGEGLDGYDDPPNKFKNQHPDQYRYISIGLKYNFGLIRAYTKRIRGYTFF